MPAEQVFGKESMIWLTAIVELVKAIVWPFLLALIFIAYRRHVGLLLLTCVKVLRRVKRLKFGGMELDAKAIEIASAATQEKVERVQEKLVSENLQPEEKKMLLKQLTEAVAEAERLRSFQQHYSSSAEMMQPVIPPTLLRLIREDIGRIVDNIGGNELAVAIASGPSSDYLDSAVRAYLKAGEIDGAPVVPTQAMYRLLKFQILHPNLMPTSYGRTEFMAAARRKIGLDYGNPAF